MKRYISYLKYIFKHKWYVLLECFKRKQYWRGIMHDMSKLMPDEFFPYAHYFYLENGERYTGAKDLTLVDNFNKAWLKHIHRNPHHWQYWLLKMDNGANMALKMPEQFVEEMFCDWVGAGKAIMGIHSNVAKWYENNENNMILHNLTRANIESKIRRYLHENE